MGFPVGYSELPRLLLHLLFILAHIRRLINWLFNSLGLGSLLDSETQWHDTNIHSHHQHHHHYQLQQQQQVVSLSSVFAQLIQESLPVIQYEQLLVLEGSNNKGLQESCVVCLYEFDAADEIRRMKNCRHVFHRQCVDRWAEHGQCTCPLCRAPIISCELNDYDCIDELSDIDDEYSFSLSSMQTFVAQVPSL